MSYCGVGSHHQNGIAERRIKSLCEDARTMLAHGTHVWPQVITKSLRPFAIKAACRARNRFNLDDSELSPEMILANLKMKAEIRNEHPLFCPVFTLNKILQSETGMMPKWNPRSTAGVYLGHSHDHASNVALVLNLTTGLVSPQYHVIFDDTFSTVDYIHSRNEPSNWENLCKHHTEEYQMVPTSTARINGTTDEIKWIRDLNDVSETRKPQSIPSNEPNLVQTPEGEEIAENDNNIYGSNDEDQNTDNMEHGIGSSDTLDKPDIDPTQTFQRYGRRRTSTSKLESA